jgi:drug/metabolite transporter (DMT)-like permease
LVPLGLFYFLIRHVTVTYSTIISYIIPLVAVFTGVMVLDEQLQPGIILGGGLVVAAVVTKDLLRTREARGQATQSPEEC